MTYLLQTTDSTETLWRRDGDKWFGVCATLVDGEAHAFGTKSVVPVTDANRAFADLLEKPPTDAKTTTKSKAVAWAANLPADWQAQLFEAQSAAPPTGE